MRTWRGCGCWLNAELIPLGRRIGGIGSFVRRDQNRGWEETDRLHGTVGEKSIDFLEKLYRLSPDTL